MLADAHGETLRLAALAEDLLLLARADAGVETPPEVDTSATVVEGSTRKTPLVELDHAVLQLVRQLRRRLSMEGSTLKLDIGPIAPVRVRGDEESLRRGGLLPLPNAAQYTPNNSEDGLGGVTISVEKS